MASRRLGTRVRDVDVDVIERWAVPLRKVRDYCRLTVEGLENLPQGQAILVANHTGWAGLDYVNLFLTLYDEAQRIPRVAVHPTLLRMMERHDQAAGLGMFEVSVQTSTRILDEGGLVTFFPEAEAGNFKPIWKRYQLQDFKPGFARVALATMAPVVPVVIIGGEDANPSLGKFRFLPKTLDMPFPIPLSLLPLPVKWRIRFMEPIDPTVYLEGDAADKDVPAAMAVDIRRRMQEEVKRQLDARGNPFF